MGQKVNPVALRLGIHHDFKSVGYYPKNMYAKAVLKDIRIREALMKKLKPAGVGDVIIERSASSIKIIIYVMRPGIVIGRGGSGLEELKKDIVKLLGANETAQTKNSQKVELRVEPIKEPNLSAYLVASNIAEQLARRMPFKRIVKQSLDRIMQSGAKGCKDCSFGTYQWSRNRTA